VDAIKFKNASHHLSLICLDVRFQDCDSQGHVHNAVYFTYLRSRCCSGVTMTGAPQSTARVIVARAGALRAPAFSGEQLDVR
jgi:acyl-CoA thioesterase FadM